MDNKLTDNEIIKALECCASSTGCEACRDCPLDEEDTCIKDGGALQRYALDLINRQKTEKETMQAYIDHLKTEIDRLQEVIFKQEDTAQILHKEHQETIDELQFAKTEIERLQKANELLKYLKEAVHRVEIGGKEEIVEYASDEAFQNAITKKLDLMCNVQTAKSEARKELAERLKEKTYFLKDEEGFDCTVVFVSDIDNLLKEMESKTE